MTPTEQRVHDDAIAFARANKKTIAKRLTDKTIHPPEDEPVSALRACLLTMGFLPSARSARSSTAKNTKARTGRAFRGIP